VAEPVRSEPPIDPRSRHAWRAGADQFGDGDCGGSNRGDGQIADRKHRRQVALAGELDGGQQSGLAADGKPDCAQKVWSRRH